MKNLTGYTKEELGIMRNALTIVESAANSTQDECWPGDGPAHDDHCALSDHGLATAAVKATEGLSWEFSSWSRTADWFRSTLEDNAKRDRRLLIKVNLKGEKFGLLTVKRLERRDEHRKAYWRCECRCGRIRIVRGERLRDGMALSCGSRGCKGKIL